jgi:hypothetical protein
MRRFAQKIGRMLPPSILLMMNFPLSIVADVAELAMKNMVDKSGDNKGRQRLWNYEFYYSWRIWMDLELVSLLLRMRKRRVVVVVVADLLLWMPLAHSY